ncbi:MAG TPA: BTAD domain-containing putative transcriptional regulator, partial [Acidimicrobiales bacterium]
MTVDAERLTSTVPPGRVTHASPPSLGVAVRLLGPVALVRADGSAIDVPSQTQRRLLAVLALHRGRALRPEQLADLLDLSPGALRKVVSRLRALVGDEGLCTDALGYRLDLHVDAERFAGIASATDPDADPSERLLELEAALALWHGTALDEFAAEPWAQGDTTRLEELHGAA